MSTMVASGTKRSSSPWKRRQRTFVCGDSRYEIRPGAGLPRGDMIAEVEDQTTVSECVRYERRPDGSQVCVEQIQRVVVERNVKRARLRVLREGSLRAHRGAQWVIAHTSTFTAIAYASGENR